jgi:dTDP-4-dehydrorhamnose 3,5-epimerase
MRLVPTRIRAVVIVEPQVLHDERGWFMETFNEPRFQAALAALGLPAAPPFVQDNHSCSRAGVLRGLHYQAVPHAQGKLIRVVRGAAWDVAVDLRTGSPTRGQWVGMELTEANRRQLWIPEGFAHGFLALSDDTQVVYKVTDVHAPECERVIAWNDPELAIDWPLHRLGGPPLLAPRDAGGAPFAAAHG